MQNKAEEEKQLTEEPKLKKNVKCKPKSKNKVKSNLVLPYFRLKEQKQGQKAIQVFCWAITNSKQGCDGCYVLIPVS